jgi:hypothetical protein
LQGNISKFAAILDENIAFREMGADFFLIIYKN